MGILGVIELFLGFIALASPWIVGASFIWVIGIMLMVLAVVRLIQVFTVPSSRGWNLVTAILYGIAGWFLFREGKMPGVPFGFFLGEGHCRHWD